MADIVGEQVRQFGCGRRPGSAEYQAVADGRCHRGAGGEREKTTPPPTEKTSRMAIPAWLL